MPNSKAKILNNAIKRNDAAVKFDNHWRQSLGIADPNDPEEFARGLLGEYTIEAETIELEKTGLQRVATDTLEVAVASHCASGEEAERAIEDVERDLRTLTRDSSLKDIDVELEAWGRDIRAISADGINSAQFALDPRQRDRAYAARRGLGDYARLARYVGALTKGANEDYRQLAQSLDVVSSLILVLMGEAQAEAGVRSGQFLLQVPASELQVRRDAVLNALRALTGSVAATSDNFNNDEQWPRNLEAYRQFCAYLDQAGLSDLRSLCDEHALAHQLNQLVDMASGGSIDSLRSLGAIWHGTVNRINRLLFAAQTLVKPSSPGLTRFLSALALFIEGFENGSAGSRLLFIARPHILHYGHYGIGAIDDGTEYLQAIVQKRGKLAEALDCYLSCDCDIEHVRCQILMDKILFDVDRAIDLYTIGSDPSGSGKPEERAAGYGAVINAFLDKHKDCLDTNVKPGARARARSEIEATLEGLMGVLGWDESTRRQLPDRSLPLTEYDEGVCRMHSEICGQLQAERTWENLVRRMAPGCRQSMIFPPDAQPVIEEMLENGRDGAIDRIRRRLRGDKDLCDSCEIESLLPPTVPTSFEVLTHAVSRTGARKRDYQDEPRLYEALRASAIELKKVQAKSRPDIDIDIDIDVTSIAVLANIDKIVTGILRRRVKDFSQQPDNVWKYLEEVQLREDYREAIEYLAIHDPDLRSRVERLVVPDRDFFLDAEAYDLEGLEILRAAPDLLRPIESGGEDPESEA